MIVLRADLHIHTTASDGKLTPSQVVALAVERRLDAIAITDHDSFSGVNEAEHAARNENLEIIRGAEVSTLFEGRECHLLAYAFDDAELMQKLLGTQKTKRVVRAKAIIKKLNRLGFDITFDEVIGEAGTASIGRPHIARILVKKGYAADHRDAFIRYLGNTAGAYHKIDYPDVSEAIECVKAAGGYSVLAHPASNYNFIELKQLKDLGLDGVECFHPSHNSYHQRRYLEYCDASDLMATGGSDFHGTIADYYHFGVIHCNLEPDNGCLKRSAATDYSKTGTHSEMLCK